MRKKAVFIVCYLAYTFIYIGRLNLTMASPALKSQNIFTSAQIGLLGSVFFVVYALGRLVNGVLSTHMPSLCFGAPFLKLWARFTGKKRRRKCQPI